LTASRVGDPDERRSDAEKRGAPAENAGERSLKAVAPPSATVGNIANCGTQAIFGALKVEVSSALC